MAVKGLKQDRLYEFTRRYFYGGANIASLKKVYGFEYKKGKTDKDVKQIAMRACNAGYDTNTLLLTVAKELDTVFNNA